MKLVQAAAGGAIAAISLPFILRSEPGVLGQIVHYGTVYPAPGTFAFPFSVPIFLFVTLFALFLLGWANR